MLFGDESELTTCEKVSVAFCCSGRSASQVKSIPTRWQGLREQRHLVAVHQRPIGITVDDEV